VRFGVLMPPGVHPVSRGPIVDPQVPGHLRDGLAGLDHHLHGLSLELRAELLPMLWHRTDPLSRAESHYPRSLIHLRLLVGMADLLRDMIALSVVLMVMLSTVRPWRRS
jgi:hypothetical protein